MTTVTKRINSPLKWHGGSKGAEFSPCRLYRYTLWRHWGDYSRTVAFVGLNPSTADEAMDDPTIRRCIRFAQKWGFDGMYMLNIFAYRATDPKAMKAAADPVGPLNDDAIDVIRDKCELTVCCWGSHGTHRNRGLEALAQMKHRGGVVKAFGFTANGQPKHPLYLPKNAKLKLWDLSL